MISEAKIKERRTKISIDKMIVHLIDGTYELFRHFYGIRRFKKTDPRTAR